MFFLFGRRIFLLALKIGIIDAISEATKDEKNADCGEYIFCSAHNLYPLFVCADVFSITREGKKSGKSIGSLMVSNAEAAEY